jgi:hypothetical protein
MKEVIKLGIDGLAIRTRIDFEGKKNVEIQRGITTKWCSRKRRKVILSGMCVGNNLNENVSFYTFTTGEGNERNKDVSKAWRNFLSRWRANKKFPLKSYVWVVEKHNSSRTSEKKRFSFHYHLFTSEFYNISDIQDLWYKVAKDYNIHVGVNNSVDLRLVELREADNMAPYMVKTLSSYMTKDRNTEFELRQLWGRSRDISRQATEEYIEIHDIDYSTITEVIEESNDQLIMFKIDREYAITLIEQTKNGRC